MSVGEVKDYLHDHWPQIKQNLENGSYRPEAIKRVEILKGDERMRKLGIPTVFS